jgi:V8-like Glu-specific endopeptidase
MSRSRSLALIVASALTAALAPAALASAAAPASADRADQARAEHERIVAYWTPERMKAAKPRDFVRQKDGSFALAPTPKAKGKPSGSNSASVTGASWPNGRGPVVKRTGKVFFRMGGGGYVCSGSVADDLNAAGYSIVLTAGHCAYDETNKAFATDWLFIPDFDSNPNLNTSDCSQAVTTYGCWTAKALVVHSGYASAGGFNTQATLHDFAFAVVPETSRGELDVVVGSYPVTMSTMSVGSTMSAFGYPASGKYAGKDLTYCSGPIVTDRLNGNLTWGLACDMTGGSSGGPWLRTGSGELDLSTGAGGTLASLNSYGYSGKAYMYGPKFNSTTADVLGAARKQAAAGLSAVRNEIVP